MRYAKITSLILCFRLKFARYLSYQIFEWLSLSYFELRFMTRTNRWLTVFLFEHEGIFLIKFIKKYLNKTITGNKSRCGNGICLTNATLVGQHCSIISLPTNNCSFQVLSNIIWGPVRLSRLCEQIYRLTRNWKWIDHSSQRTGKLRGL